MATFRSMSTPLTRGDFEERLGLLREQLREGKMFFAKGIRGVDELLRVRYLPNGRIDLLTISESSRLNANMSYEMLMTDIGGELKAAMTAANVDGEQAPDDGLAD